MILMDLVLEYDICQFLSVVVEFHILSDEAEVVLFSTYKHKFLLLLSF